MSDPCGVFLFLEGKGRVLAPKRHAQNGDGEKGMYISGFEVHGLVDVGRLTRIRRT